MVTRIVERIQTEYQHWLKLNDSSRKLLISFLVFEFVLPLIFGFINAFLFRQTSTFWPLLIYNVAFFCTIPFFFYLNGLALQRGVSLKLLYTLGLVGQGLVLNVIFFLPSVRPIYLILFGLLQGSVVGLYWANRNFLTQEVTTDANRTYFVGIEQLFGILGGLISPAVIGAVIGLGARYGWYSSNAAYQALSVVSLVMLSFSGWLLKDLHLDAPTLSKTLVGFKASFDWNLVRVGEALYGTFHGIFMFLPALIVFALIGNEAELGLMQSGAAVLTTLVVYYFSRKMSVQQRSIVAAVAISLMVLTTLIYSTWYVTLTAVLLLVFSPSIRQVTWLTWFPTVMTAIDNQDGKDRSTNYAYVVDREIAINVGRLIGVAVFVVVLRQLGEEAAIRYIPLFIGLCMIGLGMCIHQLNVVNQRLQ